MTRVKLGSSARAGAAASAATARRERATAVGAIRMCGGPLVQVRMMFNDNASHSQFQDNIPRIVTTLIETFRRKPLPPALSVEARRRLAQPLDLDRHRLPRLRPFGA